MKELPYFFVRRLATGRWCVAHRVPGADVDAVDVDCLTLRAAQVFAAQLNKHRDSEWEPGRKYRAEANH